MTSISSLDHAYDAGYIDPDWLSQARTKALDNNEIETWFGVAISSLDVSVESDGSVYDNAGYTWLTQSEVDAACARIDLDA